MLFTSLSFALLYLMALLIRWGSSWLGPWAKPSRIIGLLLMSWVFYAWHVPWYIFLIVINTTVVFVAARLLSQIGQEHSVSRRWVPGLAIGANLGLLLVFKYAGFFSATASNVSGWNFSFPDLILPIGISFYTFQSISYVTDVYRGAYNAETRFTRLALYISFFPQLIAGPIVRASEFLYQLDRPRRFHPRIFMEGAYLIVRGLFLKVIVADNLGRIVDEQWQSAADGGGTAFVVLVFFAGQLLCDFAGYVDIARGLAYQLGIRLPINFNAPYLAMSFSEFWRRWHITLSRWMKDYLYIPLGGNRGGAFRTACNLMVVMLISGLWHGASWTFVFWGGLLGSALLIERVMGWHRHRPSLLLRIFWYLVVQLTWIFSLGLFRAENLEQGFRVIAYAATEIPELLVGSLALGENFSVVILGCWLLLPLVLMHLRVFLQEAGRVAQPGPLERCCYAGLMLAALLSLYSNQRTFIYFQF